MPSVHHDRPAHAGEAPPERPAQPSRTGCGWRLATDGQTVSFGRCHTEAQRPLARGDRATGRSSSTQRRCTDGRPCRARPCGAAESRGQCKQAARRQAELHQLPSGAVPAAQPLPADARAAVADARALRSARQGRADPPRARRRLLWRTELTRTPRGLRSVRAGYAYQPTAHCTYRRHRAACPQPHERAARPAPW